MIFHLYALLQRTQRSHNVKRKLEPKWQVCAVPG
jgi:hypothetical protein